ncbi:hypothetical protein [Cellulomonas marina]|nr:hypothetical protein [Cellulomonas marina]GIG29063.1 hypothetical protein Cma02nite_16630 [Cellulomonas marina]
MTRPSAEPRGRSLVGPVVGAVLAALVGAAALVAGQADDSPGLGGLGLLVALTGVVLAVRSVRRRRSG